LRAPELYEASKQNDTEKVLALLKDDVSPKYIDESTGWTVSYPSKVHHSRKFFTYLLLGPPLGIEKWERKNREKTIRMQR